MEILTLDVDVFSTEEALHPEFIVILKHSLEEYFRILKHSLEEYFRITKKPYLIMRVN